MKSLIYVFSERPPGSEDIMAKKIYRILSPSIVLAGLFLFACQQDAWHMQKAPLMTRWAHEVTPDNVLPEYPRPQMRRAAWKNLNGLWEIALRNKEEPPEFGKNLKQQILVPFAVESALSGIMEKSRYLTYRRTFEIDDNWQGQKIILHFGAVDWSSTVFVNGQLAGKHEGGYDDFHFEITSFLMDQGANELIVQVYDPTDDGLYPRGKQVDKPGGIFYTSVTGIWQTVWLEAVSPKHIKSFTMIPDIDQEKLTLSIKTEDATNDEVVALSVFSDDKIITEMTVPVENTEMTNLQLSVPDPILWSPDDPHLYDIKIKLMSGDIVHDEIDSYFAMRKISIGKDREGTTRLLLNNKYVFQNGPLDQGYWPDGLYTAPTDEALRYDIEMTKKFGFNMIRKHTKIEPDRWYYWTDKLGVLVWQDMPSVNPTDFAKRQTAGHKKQFEYELKQMIDQHFNHPSIVMWVVFNEGWGQYDTERLTKLVKSMDPDRLVSNASGWTDKNVGDILDWHRYPGPAAPKPEDKRAAVLGEFGGLGLPFERHLWEEKNWGYQNFKDQKAYRDRYEKLYDEIWQLEKEPGLSACVYTQTTDVETEVNGLMTYDREIVKLDLEDAQAFHSDRLTSAPHFISMGKLFLESATCTLRNRKGEPIFYTVDGSEPTHQSMRYTRPVVITKSLILKAKSIAEHGKSSGTVSADFEKAVYREPEKNRANLQPGLDFDYFEGEWNVLPEFPLLCPKASGIAPEISIEPRERNDYFGFIFKGFIRIDRDGIYSFYTESNDGSQLYIGDKCVVDNDGLHRMREKRGDVALRAGYHPLRITFFESGGDEGLVVRYLGPDIAKQEIPQNVLFN
ncbi:MAG: glycoside hydrolase family 2 [Calditrichaeota bacterium]|nr:MAG: glycoside hydrolase family 2 [Calditrichota bacterium]